MPSPHEDTYEYYRHPDTLPDIDEFLECTDNADRYQEYIFDEYVGMKLYFHMNKKTINVTFIKIIKGNGGQPIGDGSRRHCTQGYW